MSQKGILIALGVLVVVVSAAVFMRPTTSNVSKDLSRGFQVFRKADFDEVDRITIKKGKTKDPGSLELRRKGDGWVLPTAWDYPADKKRVEELIDELKKVKTGERRGSKRASHPQFKLDEEKGVQLALYDKQDRPLAEMVIGADAQSRTLSSGSFVRFGEEDEVWQVEANLRNKVISYPDKVEAKTFLDKVIFKLPDDHEAVRVSLFRGDKSVLVEKRVTEVPVEKKEEEKKEEAEKEAGSGSIAEEKKPETKKEEEYWVTAGTASFKVDKSKEWDAKGLLTRDLRAEDAAERKDPKEYGLDQPHLRAAIIHRKRDQKDAPEVTTTIAFGNAIKEEKEGTEKGENKAYYVMLEGEAGAGRIYTLSKWDYNSWNKELKDFEKPPEPKPAEKPAEPAEKKAEEKNEEAKAEGKLRTVSSPVVTALPPAPPPAAEGPEKVTASHILFMHKGSKRAPEGITRTKEEARKEAEAVLAELKKDPSKFGELAQEKSDCPSKASSGDLGDFGRGVMAKPFEEAAFSLKPGGLSGVVETEFGFHVIQRTK